MSIRPPVKNRRLGDLCHVFQGLSVARQGGELQWPMVQIRDIEHGRVDPSNLAVVEADERIVAGYRLKAGDVLVSARGTIGKVALVTEGENYILSANLIGLRPKAGLVTSPFLYAYLSMPQVLQQLNVMVRPSTTVKSIRVSDMRDLSVPVPPLQDQERIGALALAYDEYRMLAQQCIETSRKVIDGILRSQLEGG